VDSDSQVVCRTTRGIAIFHVPKLGENVSGKVTTFIGDNNGLVGCCGLIELKESKRVLSWSKDRRDILVIDLASLGCTYLTSHTGTKGVVGVQLVDHDKGRCILSWSGHEVILWNEMDEKKNPITPAPLWIIKFQYDLLFLQVATAFVDDNKKFRKLLVGQERGTSGSGVIIFRDTTKDKKEEVKEGEKKEDQ